MVRFCVLMMSLILFSMPILSQQEYAEITFDKDPFLENPTQWQTGGNANWVLDLVKKKSAIWCDPRCSSKLGYLDR